MIKNSLLLTKLSKTLLLFVFAIYLVIGFGVYKDYSVSWDEPTSRLNGAVNYKFLDQKFSFSDKTFDFSNIPDLKSYQDKDYGVAFELPIFCLEKILDIKVEKDVYRLRHLLTFLFCFIGVLAFFKAVHYIYNDYFISLIAVLMLITSPRFFAESFYNSKDLVFMAAISIALWSLIYLVRKITIYRVFIHAFFTALAIDIRIMGIVMPLLTCLALLSMKDNLTSVSKNTKVMICYLFLTTLFVVLMFPYLWESPIHNLINVFHNMSKFRWVGQMLYRGEVIWSTELPWHYIPTWILITTPIFFTLLFVIGNFVIVGNLLSYVKKPSIIFSNYDFLALALVLAPVLAVIVMSSVLYDGWRQLYFIYPAFLIVALRGLKSLVDIFGRRFKQVYNPFIALVFATIIFNIFWIYKNHPFQNIYFNSFAGSNLREKYDLDYWGLANKEAIEYILKNDSSPKISLKAFSNTPLDRAVIMLDQSQKRRLLIVGANDNATYILNNYRQVSKESDAIYAKSHYVFFQKKVDGEIFLTIFKKRF
jgi:hypothetical protein